MSLPGHGRVPGMPKSPRSPLAPKPESYWVEIPREEGVIRELTFHDVRPPEQVQAGLERHLMSPLTPDDAGERLRFHTAPKINGSPFTIDLSFDAAFPDRNRYTLRVETSWAGSHPANLDYARNSARGWFTFWTRDFAPHATNSSDPGSPELYRERRQQALAAEAELASIATIQRRILDGVRAGGEFSTSHKEGGTRILFRAGKFVSSSYGESNEVQAFQSDTEFLQYLRQFFDWETSRNVAPAKVPDPIAWRLILRLLRERDVD